jgi:hypothetical protein
MITPALSRPYCFRLSDLLNQYTEREYPGALDARGMADAGFTVDVNGVPATRTGADYFGVGTFNNSSGAVLGELEIEITDPGPATGAAADRNLFAGDHGAYRSLCDS